MLEVMNYLVTLITEKGYLSGLAFDKLGHYVWPGFGTQKVETGFDDNCGCGMNDLFMRM